MSLVTNPECPKCKSKRTMPHCQSPTCSWGVCKPCTTKTAGSILVFDGKNRTMNIRG